MRNEEKEKFASFTDTLNVLQAFQEIYTTTAIIQQIQDTLYLALNQNTQIAILWIPSQVEIVGNETADKAAMKATTLAPIIMSTPASDF